MSERFPGGLITKTPVTPSGPYETDTASGIWTLDQQMQYAKQGIWPTAGNMPKDAQFNYVTMLLHGDGTNGAQNNTFLDSSTNNFTITRNGNTTQGSFSPYGDNWSNYFDGTSSYLTLNSNASMSFGTSNFTIEGWFFTGDKSVSGGASRTLIGNSGNSYTEQLYISTSGYLTFGNTGSTFIAGSTDLANNTWHHFAVSRSGTSTNQIAMWVDGTRVAQGTNSQNYTSGTIYIGAFGTTDGFWNGYISNLRIVNGSAVYDPANSTITVPTTPLTAITNTALLTCQANRFFDASTNAYTVTATGSPSVQRFNPFGASTAYSTSVIGGSGYFDGSGDSLQTTAGAIPAIGTSDFIISGWWYLNELKNYQILLDFRNGTNNAATPYVYVDSSGGADYYANGTSHIFSVNFKANQWYYMVISRVSGTTKIFLNGTEVVSYSDSVSYIAGRLTLGFNDNGSGTYYYYNGYISDFKVVIGSGTTSGTPTTTPATATSGTQALLSMTNGAIYDNAMMNDLETVGNAQISTSVKKYGTGSLAFDGSGDYLSTPASPNLSFGSGDFTIELWFNFNASLSNNSALIASKNYYTSGFNGNWLFRFSTTSTIAWASYDGQSNEAYKEFTVPTMSNGTWYHVAIVRSGTTITLYFNGTASSSGTLTDSKALNDGGTNGIYVAKANINSDFNGYIDDLRITKGYARYTANFTPPTAAFPNTGPN